MKNKCKWCKPDKECEICFRHKFNHRMAKTKIKKPKQDYQPRLIGNRGRN